VRVIKGLERLRVVIYNPDISWDKYDIHRILAAEPSLRPHLPETVPSRRRSYAWFRERLLAGREVFVKPRTGSLGLGVARVYRVGPGRYCYESRTFRRKTTLRGAWRLVRRRRGRALLQEGIPLLEDEGRRVDFRVPVQRDGDNEWRVPGIAAKRAEKHAFLTNLARGGSVHDGREVLARAFGPARAARIAAEMERVAILAARTLNARHPYLVDFGFDIGVDREGRPYVIEANRRDLRVLLAHSGQAEANADLFKNPIAYGRYLLEHHERSPRN